MALSSILLPLAFILLPLSSGEEQGRNSHIEIAHAFVSHILSGMSYLTPEQQLQTIDVFRMSDLIL